MNWIRRQLAHRWFDVFIAFVFGLAAPPILESPFVEHLLHGAESALAMAPL
jgi:hypothetical protein